MLPLLILAAVAVTTSMADYTYVPGFFLQDNPNANASEIGALPDRFGLLDDAPGYWDRFKEKIDNLNDVDCQESFKVLFLGRHGEGYHNVAEAKYGTPAWDAYWSELDGDGALTWGPDALLTATGVAQAEDAHNAWIKEIPTCIPVPTVFYSSPLSRALRTCEITWNGIIVHTPGTTTDGISQGGVEADNAVLEHSKVVVKEYCREVYGEHTCDQRRNKTYIQETFPEFVTERGFTEEDELWTTVRETESHVEFRAKGVLDQLWENHPEDTYVSITAHSGFISALLTVVGRGSYSLPTGGVIPIVVKGVKN